MQWFLLMYVIVPQESSVGIATLMSEQQAGMVLLGVNCIPPGRKIECNSGGRLIVSRVLFLSSM